MPRVLTMHERRIDDSEREGYFAALQTRRDTAKAAHAHFWVFEHGVEHGRFVEFLEAGDTQSLVAAHAAHTTVELWREVETN